MSAHVEIEDLSRRFGETEALSGVDLRVERGERLVVLGPSGCGKTTLLRAVAGLEAVDRGEIRLRGERVSAPGLRVDPARRGIGFVFQDLALWPNMRVARQLDFAAGRRLASAERAALLERFRLAGLERRRPAELSGGEQQRLALARALVAGPDLLLLDEPLAALDVATAEELRGVLRAIARERELTIIDVTHRQEEAFELADRIAVMRAGRLEQVASPEDILDRPANAFVARFVSRAAMLDGTAAEGAFRCALGAIPIPAGVTLPEHPRLAVRESRLEFRPGADGAARARVTDRAFLGETWRVEVDCDGARLRARCAVAPEIGVEGGLEFRGTPWFVSGGGEA
ncbi:MAG: ABC transporter ATP-binding protein [Planctomycetota bacterium]